MSERVSFHDLSKLDAAGRDALMRRTEADLEPYLETVRPIVERVRREGDAALVHYARELDKAELRADQLRATAADFARARAELEPEVTEAIAYAVSNIRQVHEAQKPKAFWLDEVRPGVFAGERTVPIPSVACYVPRGKGAFPSVTMMTTVPAMVAGVKRAIIVTPPGPGGAFDAATLVAAETVGVTEVYRVGGAQAVAAVAYGTETLPKVAKIVGPGSPWVVAAKRLLADRIDTGLPAGPSESIVLADGTADGRMAALDLIIESEHGPDSSAYLVTDSAEVAEAAMAALPGYWAMLGEQRAGFSKAVLCGPRGGIVLAPDFDAAVAFVNDYAPEHLEILSAEPLAHLGRIENAAEVLLGPHTPITLGNFVIGVNCVLPTSGAARTWSALSVHDFQKRISVAHVTAKGYPDLAKQAHALAAYEGFDGHALAVSKLRDDLLGRAPPKKPLIH
ncbi:MAG: histidinol dehydrogenase [Geminicoccaceae bacterium]|nr:MAG: histidinol dehydrogenase [Geminicoccaceae bacterium]